MTTQLILTLFFIIIFNSSFGQTLQFEVVEIVSLFDMTQNESYKFLADKNYSFKGNEADREIFSKKTNLGEYKLKISFKDGKPSIISTYEHLLAANHIISDLTENFFTLRYSPNGEDSVIPYNDCFYLLKNSNLGLLCSFIRPSYLQNTIIFLYGRDTITRVTGSLLTKLKGDKKQKILLAEKEREQEYQKEINGKLRYNIPFYGAALKNTPIVIIKDTTKFSQLLFTCIYKSKYGDSNKTTFGNLESDIPYFIFDTTRRLTEIRYSSNNISNNCLKEFYDILELNETGKIIFNKKENKVTSGISFQINYNVIQKPLIQNVRINKHNQINSFDKEDSFTKIISDYFTNKKPEKGKYIFKAIQVEALIKGKFYFNQGDFIKYHFNKIVDITGQRIISE